MAQTEKLVPWHPKDVGLQRRDTPSTITLQDELSLYWGSANGSTFVNVTLNTGETELVISTEYFADELVNVQCDGDLILQFKSNETFQAAIADWSWVNFADNRTFFMINNWGPCASSSENGRQPWIVRNVDKYDEENFIVNFNATLTTWEIAAGNSVIEFGSLSPSVSKRDKTYSKSFSISLAHSLPQTFYSKSTNSGLDFSIDCPGCATTGSINIVGQIVLSTTLGVATGIKSISISAAPQGVGANLALGFGVSGTLGSGWQHDWNLVTVGLPGWSIPLILDVGPQFSVDAGFDLSGIQGSAEISAGVGISIPDSSSAVLGIMGVDSSSNGWVPTVTPTSPQISVEVNGNLELYVEMSVDIGVTIFEKWGYGGGLYLRVPDVNLGLGAEFDNDGVCAGSSDVFGVTFDCSVGVNLGLGVYTESGGDKDWKANHTIYQNNNLITPINKCFPLGPSLSPSASGVSIKTVGSAKPTSKTTTSPTAKPSSSSAKPSSSSAKPSSSSAKSSGTGVISSSKAAGTGASHITTKASGTGVSSSSKIAGTGASHVTTKASGTGVSFSSKIAGTGGSQTTKASGTGILSMSKVSGTAVSKSTKEYVTGASSSTTFKQSVTGVTSKATGVSSKASGTGVFSKAPETSVSSKASGTGVSSSSAVAHSSASSSGIKTTISSTSVSLSSAIHTTGTAVSTSGKVAATPSGTTSACDKWAVVEDSNCSCLNIETQYGVSSSDLLTWNPSIGTDCKLIIGDSYCVGVKTGYSRRAIGGRLARFVDA